MKKDYLCSKCYLESKIKYPLTSFDITLCAHCKSMQLRKKWIEYDDVGTAIKNKVLWYLKKEYKNVEGITFEVYTEPTNEKVWHGTMRIKFEDDEIKYEFYAKIVRKTCDVCSRMHGKYYEAIIQVRAASGEMDNNEKMKVVEVVEDALKLSGDRRAFISKMSEVHGGIDIYISNNSVAQVAARNLSSTFSTDIMISKKLVGRKNGKNRYRTTYLVRIPIHSSGNIILLKKMVCLVLGRKGRKIKLIVLPEGKEIYVDKKEVENAELIPRDKIMDAIVVWRKDDEMEIIHPTTMISMQIPVPKYLSRDAQEKVKIVDIHDEIVILPD